MTAEVDWFPKPGFWTAALPYSRMSSKPSVDQHCLNGRERGAVRYWAPHLLCSISQILQFPLPPLSGCQQKFLPRGSLYLKPRIAMENAGVFLIWSQSLFFLDTSCDGELSTSRGGSGAPGSLLVLKFFPSEVGSWGGGGAKEVGQQ